MLTSFILIILSRFRKIRVLFGIKKDPVKIKHTRAGRMIVIKRREFLAKGRRLKQSVPMSK